MKIRFKKCDNFISTPMFHLLTPFYGGSWRKYKWFVLTIDFLWYRLTLYR